MMKKFFVAAMAAVLAFSLNVSAQHYNNARFGITGGLTSASGKIKDVDTKSISQYHAGIALEIPTWFAGDGETRELVPWGEDLLLPKTGILCIDTGCGKGGRLSAMVIRDRLYQLVSVTGG